MKTTTSLIRFTKRLSVAVLLCTSLRSVAVDFALSSATSGPSKRDMGVFNAGEVLSISFSGQISLFTGWDTFADGSLVHPVSASGGLSSYGYVNVGAAGYPTMDGGDGTNHFAGGGANYDVNAASYGLAGATTTDTTNPNAFRFGSVVGTFSANPSRSNWFFVGLSNIIVVPSNGVHLYLAVHDTTYPNNSGSYAGRLLFVDPPLLSIQMYAGLELEGIVGQNYRIDYTPSLLPVNWTVFTNIVLPSSPYLFFDITGPAVGRRYYRAVKTP